MTGAEERQGILFPKPADFTTGITINDRCVIHSEQDYRIVIVSGIPLAQYAVRDKMAEGYAMVSLVEQGWASQKEVARAFGCSTRSVRRYQCRFNADGLSALGHSRGYPSRRPRVSHARERLLSRLKSQGIANKEIARRIGVTPKAVRKLLKRMGWRNPESEQFILPVTEPGGDPKLSAFSSRMRGDTPEKSSASSNPKLSIQVSIEDEPAPFSLDTDPSDRRMDRLLAYLGLLDDAAPLFRTGNRIPHGGVLLALPALVDSGIFTIARKIYGSIGPAFYGLRTTFIALLLMALLRIKQPESLKEHSPDDFGRILGLDRAPEVKTLRRKLSRLAALGRAADLGRALAQKRVEDRGVAMGFLYVDGHVRVYHGKRILPKAHVARRRLAMPATTDYWINDVTGDPVFVVTADANAGMVKMLPIVLEQVRALVGERRVTVVFDRGGFSPKLFLRLITDGFDILTYRKGRTRPVARSRFKLHEGVIDGRKVSYTLADQGIRLLAGKLRLRQVTRLREDNHQTPVLTSRRDLSAVEIAFRMFERWRQENFFKYLREEYALDALVDYAVVPDNPVRDVPNPKRIEMTAKLQQARAEFERLTAEYGAESFMNAEQTELTQRHLKTAQKKLARRIREAFDRIVELQQKRKKVPSRIPVNKVVGEDVVKLDPERKLLTNLVKMVAYQAESDLVHLVTPYYKRAADEGRTLIQSALAGAADIEVRDDELHVSIAPLSSPHRTRAIAELCQELNRQLRIFPGSRLQLTFEISSPKMTRKRTVS
jgi:DNA-binding CsgD family transcriptional regulator